MIYDKKRYPIREGDVLKVLHFIDKRGRRQYMYKMAWSYTLEDGKKVLLASHLDRADTKGFSVINSYRLPAGILETYEIVQGYNNEDDELDFHDRQKAIDD